MNILKAAVVATGSELLTGLVQDSNSNFLAAKLSSLGYQMESIYICGDQKKEIKKNILQAAENADLIIITGGLGPTADDQTKEAFAEALDLKLNFSRVVEDKLQDIYFNSVEQMPENNLSQAYIPAGAELLENERGTAPALKVKDKKHLFYLLPGVPSELRYIFKQKIVEDLKALNKNSIFVKEFNFIGIGESALAAEVENLNFNSNLKLSYQAGKAEVKLRLTIDRENLRKDQKKEIIRAAAELIRERFSQYLYGEDKESLLDKLHPLLLEKKITISTAESFTGGLIAERLTEKAGSSAYFIGSVVAYNQSVKKKLLQIDDALLRKQGVVSRECADAMAKKTAELFSSEISIATTGAAGPGSHDGKEAGTMFISIFYKNKLKTIKINKNYGRKMNRYYASQLALFKLYRLLKEGEVN